MRNAAGMRRAGRPEKRVTARSKLPQKKWTGLHLPQKRERNFSERDLIAGERAKNGWRPPDRKRDGFRRDQKEWDP